MINLMPPYEGGMHTPMVVILPQTVLKSNNTNVRMMGFGTRKH